MILSHIRRGHKDYRFADETELRYAACSSTANHQVGSLVCRCHVGNKVGHHKIVHLWLFGKTFHYTCVVVFARLPNKLHVAFPDEVEMTEHTLVDSARTKTASHKKNCLLFGSESELLYSLLACHIRLQESLSHGVSCLYNLVSGEETLHSVVCHTYLLCLGGKMLVGHTGIGILLLYEAGDTHCRCSVESGATGISAHSHCSHGTEITDNFSHLSLAFEIVDEHTNVLGRPERAYQSSHGQSLNLITGGWHSRHLHSAKSTHKENLCIRTQCPDGIGNGYSGKDVTACTSATNDYS